MKKQVALYLFFFIVVLFLYAPTLGAGLVTDQIGWLQTYKAMGWRGIFTAFTDKSIHYVYHLVAYGMWAAFGTHAYAWGLVFVGLHALAATLVFSFFSQLLKPIANATPIAFIGSLLFATSPYQTEPLVWYACVHYLVCVCLMLAALISFVRYISTNSRGHIAAFYTCYILAVFSLEISFTLPIILALLILLYPFTTSVNRQRLLCIYVLPSLLVVAFYFVLNKTMRGSFAGHYGAAAHFNVDLNLLMGNLSKYVAKLFLWFQFVPYPKRSAVYAIFEKTKYAYLLIALLTTISAAYLLWRKKLPASVNIMLLLLVCLVLALAPILNLYFSYITNIEGDRFTYWASVFAYIIIALFALVSMRHIGILICLLLLGLNIYTLRQNIQAWHSVKQVSCGLLKSFEYYNAPRVYLLNIPDNYSGAYMFRSFAPDNAFGETLDIINGTDTLEPKLETVLHYNMQQPTDGVLVEKLDSNKLKVTFAQWGNWWWRGGVGANSYSTDNYQVEIDEWSHAYTLTLYHKQKGAVYLYQQGNNWYKVEGF